MTAHKTGKVDALGRPWEYLGQGECTACHDSMARLYRPVNLQGLDHNRWPVVCSSCLRSIEVLTGLLVVKSRRWVA